MSDPLDTYKSHWVYEIIRGVAEGCRHDSAVRLVGRWYSKGLTTLEVTAFLVWWNECNFPPLSLNELNSIIKSTMKWDSSRYTPPLKDEVVNRMVKMIKGETNISNRRK